MGSDFFYEDLKDREPDKDTHKIAGTGEIGGQECTILVSTPVDSDNSVYARRVSWVHEKTLIPLRVDYYKKGKKTPIKRLQARKLKKVQGYWVVLDSTMHDLETGSKTLLRTNTIKFDQGLPDSLFSRRGLADESIGQKFLP